MCLLHYIKNTIVVSILEYKSLLVSMIISFFKQNHWANKNELNTVKLFMLSNCLPETSNYTHCSIYPHPSYATMLILLNICEKPSITNLRFKIITISLETLKIKAYSLSFICPTPGQTQVTKVEDRSTPCTPHVKFSLPDLSIGKKQM